MATPYNTIYQYIQDDVDRPDKLDVINRRIQRALIYYHRMERWFKDMIEQVYIFSPTTPDQPTIFGETGSNSLFMTRMNPVNRLYVQDLDKRLLTRFRLVQYLNKWSSVDILGRPIQDPETGATGTLAGGDITERNPDSMFDAYGGQVSDVFYESGDFLKIKSSTPLSQVYIGYLADPLIEPVENIYSWIAKDYPALIAAKVKALMFSDMGKQDELRTAGAEVTAEERSLLANNIKLTARK